ncbi:hypothetical protein EVAR_97518_1 [Eumeta japonica]|uniref:Uncharacterized protein n=1 Tax=Eumeta variegata TaxID=151549 RepID=A0A4C1WKT5_EUMVA|nr:hypothetical protein EVAR_97518_1 [Eumeta japonica]
MGRSAKRVAHRSRPYCKPLRSSIGHHIRLRQLLNHNDVTNWIKLKWDHTGSTSFQIKKKITKAVHPVESMASGGTSFAGASTARNDAGRAGGRMFERDYFSIGTCPAHDQTRAQDDNCRRARPPPLLFDFQLLRLWTRIS